MKRLRELITIFFPDDYTIGEEDQKNPDEIQKILARANQYQWTIDGLDGTGNLLAGLNSYGAAISLRFGNEILYAAAFLPIDMKCRGNGFVVYSKNRGTREWFESDRQYHKLLVAPADKLKRIMNMLEGSSKKFYRPPITNLGILETTRNGFSSCVAGVSVARGKTSALITRNNAPWDNWPNISIIEGAGGIVTDYQGNPRQLNNCGNMVAAANRVDHERIIKLLNQTK